VAGDWIVLPFVITNLLREWLPWFDLVVLRPRGFETLVSELIYTQPAILQPWVLRSDRLRRELPQQPLVRTTPTLIDCGGEPHTAIRNSAAWTSRNPEAALAQRFKDAKRQRFPTGARAQLPLSLPLDNALLLGWRVEVPLDAQPGTQLKLHLVQRNRMGKRPLGGIALQIQITKG
jgi:hypothetical protein